MTQTVFALSLIVLATASRLLPHAPNFTPIIAIAMFSAVYFSRKEWALIIPFAAMFLSDLWIGLHSTMLYVYGSYLLIAFISFAFKKAQKFPVIAGLGFAHSFIFFAITNFGVWVSTDLYPRTAQGLVHCYLMALPFFKNTLLSTWLYSSAMFLAMNIFLQLSERPRATHLRCVK